MGLSLKKLGQSILHGINPLDNGQGWTSAPVQRPGGNRSVAQQIPGGQAVANFSRPFVHAVPELAKSTGNLVYHTAAIPVESARAVSGAVTGNAEAAIAANRRAAADFKPAVDLARFVPRAGLQVGLSAKQLVAPETHNLEQEGKYTPKGWSKAVLGNEEVNSLGNQFLDSKAAGKSTAEAYGELTLNSLMDAVALKGGVESLKKGVEKVVENKPTPVYRTGLPDEHPSFVATSKEMAQKYGDRPGSVTERMNVKTKDVFDPTKPEHYKMLERAVGQDKAAQLTAKTRSGRFDPSDEAAINTIAGWNGFKGAAFDEAGSVMPKNTVLPKDTRSISILDRTALKPSLAGDQAGFAKIPGGKDELANAAGGKRPLDALQKQIEQAHNAGDAALEAKLTAKLPDQGMNPNAPVVHRQMVRDPKTGKMVLQEVPKVTAKEASMGEALGMSKADVAKAKATANELPTVGAGDKQAAALEAPVVKAETPKASKEVVRDTKGIETKPSKQEFMGETSKYLGAKDAAKTRNVDAALNLPKLGEKESLALIDSIEKGTYGRDFAGVPTQVRGILESKFNQLKESGVDIGHLEDYFPHKWQNATAEEVASAYQTLNLKSGIQQPRTIPTISEGIEMGFKPASTDYRTAITNYLNTADTLLANRNYFNQLKSRSLIAEAGSRPQGMQVIDAPGLPQPRAFIDPETGIATQGNYYAKPDVARELNKLFGAQPENRLLKATAKASGAIQEVTLAGGLPGTPLNAFGTAQWLKQSLSGHPISATQDFFRSFSKGKSLAHERANIEYITKMQESGTPYRGAIDSSALKSFGDVLAEKSGAGKAGAVINQAWHKAVDEATFKRFLPALQLDTFKQVYTRAIKQGMDEASAVKLAGETTRHAFGLNELAKDALKSKNASNAISTFAFAPKFRESMVNFWVDNAKSLGKPGSAAYRENLKFMAGATALFGAMQAANYAVNGHSTFQNENKNDRLNLSIPVGNEGHSVSVPFLSSIATVPRTVANTAIDLATGSPKEAGLEGKKLLSQLTRPVVDLATNQKYNGRQIYNEKDDANTRRKDQATYFAGQYNHPYIQAAVNQVTGKSSGALETAATALEAPLRFRNYDVGDQSASANQSERLKAAFSDKDGKAFLKLSDADKRSKAATDTKARGLYDKYRQLKHEYEVDTKLYNAGLDSGSENTLRSVERLSSKGRDELYAKDNSAEYRYEMAKYNNQKAGGELTETEEIKAQDKLEKLKVGSKFKKETRDFYGLSKADVWDYVSTSKRGKDLVNQILAYDDALVAAGVISKNKFRDKYGNQNLQPAVKTASSGRGGKGGGSSSSNPYKYNVSARRASNVSGATSQKVAVSRLKRGSSGSSSKVALSKPAVSIKKSLV